MKAYKGFRKNADGTLQCRDKIYLPGETYTEDEAELCMTGMHACLAPTDVFSYYPPATSVYHEVEVGDDAAASDEEPDSKVVTTTLTVGAELGIHGLVQAQVEYTTGRAVSVDGWRTSQYQGAASATGELGAASATGFKGAASATGRKGAASATGYQGAASATGSKGAASATGYLGAASATGDFGVASATGYQGAASATGGLGAASATGELGAASATGELGAASATGYKGAASATGAHSIALAGGYQARARGAVGCGLTLAERDGRDGSLLGIVAVIVGRTYDGVTIEPDVYYQLIDGQIEVAE